MPKPEKYKATFFDKKQIAILISAIKNTIIFIPILIAIATGMRRGEILGLTWDNIDLKGKIIHVVQALYQINGKIIILPPKSQNSIRDISIPNILVKILKIEKKRQEKLRKKLGSSYNPNNYVCVNEIGKVITPSTLNHKFKEIISKCNLPAIRIHDLRHSHASLLLHMGFSPKAISERLGHSTIVITMDLYAHIYNEVNKKIAKAFNHLLCLNPFWYVSKWLAK